MDSFSFSQLSSPINPPSTSSDSTTTTVDGTGDCYYAEVKLMLASQNPKKRAGRTKFKETRHPVYRGVRSRNSGKQWVCEVRQPHNNSRMWLGTHATPEMAARAHDVAVLAMRGRSACLNFADSVWRLPVPESSSTKDIQKAAALAAALFKVKQTVLVEVEISDESPEVMFYAGEEDVFGSPEFMESMAEGMMIQPFQRVGYGGDFMDDVEFCVDLSLWNF